MAPGIAPFFRHRQGLAAFFLAAVFLATTPFAGAQALDISVQVSASVQASPPRIRLSWPSKSGTTGFSIYRMTFGAAFWGSPIASLPGTATGWDDTSVAVGTAYEYQVVGDGSPASAGYVASGIEVPLVESRGKLVLIVDDTVASPLQAELALLQQDLIGDGWVVLRHDVSPSDTVVNVRTLIRAEYLADPANVRSVLLFGHVPVPYSGATNPDDHPEHFGAWPADLYYGEMDGGWTDLVTFDESVAGRQRNVAGDGKFDQSAAPSAIELEVGRVDLADLPAFAPKTEIDLLRQYLGKDHAYRHAVIQAQRRGLVDDHFLNYDDDYGASAAAGWRDFSSFFGASGVQPLDWFSTLATESYLWGFAAGPSSSFDRIDDVGTTAQFASTDTKVVFTMLFGSWIGDWDSTDNFLRAPLATETWGLTSAWSGRPLWHFHHMGLGETIGYSARISQNNAGLYAGPSFSLAVWAALMGDPTLRMHVVAPPASLAATPSGGSVSIAWTPSPDAVLGYNVYRSASAEGPFSRVNGALVSGAAFVDTTAPAGTTSTWQVRAVSLESSSGGSYFNGSQGIFASAFVPRQSTTTSLSSSVNPSLTGQEVTFTATVSSSGALPTGTVTFSSGAGTLGTAPVDGFGLAVVATSALPSGTSTITASYGGDAASLPSASGGLVQTVICPPVGPLPVSAPATVLPLSTSNAASVPDAGAGAAYAWTVSGGGTITSAASSQNITFSARATGFVTLQVTVTGGSAGCGAMGTSIVPILTGDFSLDGKTDLLWRNTSSGLTSIRSMNGFAFGSVSGLPTVPGPDWEIVGSGDFDGNGSPDILWRHRTAGFNTIWLMNGLAFSSAVNLPTVSDTNWRIQAVGDLDGDGNPDIFWRNVSTGLNGVWLMNGTSIGSVIGIPAVPDTNWDIVGTADFDLDGRIDIVWRNRVNGLNGLWIMHGISLGEVASFPTVTSPEWQIVAIGDYDQDGKPDLVWRNTAVGLDAIWKMNGTSVDAVVGFTNDFDTTWGIAGPK